MIIERVQQQIADLNVLKDSWYAPGYGMAYDPSDLHWLESRIGLLHESVQSEIFIYPDPDGEVFLEWRIGSLDISFSINFTTRNGYWHCLDLCSDEDDGIEFNIDEDETWTRIDSMIREFISKNEPKSL